MIDRLFPDDNPVAVRQPKTDRLVLSRLLNQQAASQTYDAAEVDAAHAVLIKWADLETSGQLARMHETQLQGEFLGDIFATALGYSRFSQGAGRWSLEQHYTIEGQEPDAILGDFTATEPRQPRAVIELKGPNVHLDRDRSGGRTAVQQAWNYLNHTPPTCRWAIVSNLLSFRLYERDSTPRRYEHFTLQGLRDPVEFRRFYTLFHRKGLIEGTLGHPPRAVELLKRSGDRQREVGDILYEEYSKHRTRLVQHLHAELAHPLDKAIEMAQRLLDRVIFIAFCEDRRLLPDGLLRKAANDLPAFTAITNPRWQNFKTLFRFVDKGHDSIGLRPGFNGGLFAESEADNLELDDRWTQFFEHISRYDFADEVNLDVLGHLFEQSITELEKLREGGLFGGDAARAERYAAMPQSAKRKRMGIYYTPPELTSRIVEYTVDDLIAERFTLAAVRHGIASDRAAVEAPDTAAYWRECLAILRDLKVIDPACGSGAFLFQAYNVLEHRYAEVIGHLIRLAEPDAHELGEQVPEFILNDNLYGVDLSPEAVEITQLALWIRSATPGKTLATLSHNIIHGNSLVRDPAIHPAAFKWEDKFPEVFSRGEDRKGFDCVIGNPPWERIKLQEREFFSLSAPEIATATNAAKRRALIAKLEQADAELFASYRQAQSAAECLTTYCRRSKEYPLTGKGDINLYAVFAELAYKLVNAHGRVGLLTPSGIASDNTTKDFFAAVAESNRLIRLYDFENRTKTFFPDVDGRFKFCILNFGGSERTTKQADYVFFAHRVEDLEDRHRHIALSSADIKLLNPNTRTCPIFRTRRDAEITKRIYRHIPVLVDKSRKRGGNPWGITFQRMFDQTNDAEKFREAETLAKQGFKLEGNRFVKRKQVFIPFYEAKMVQMFDHRAASVVIDRSNWFRQGQTEGTSLVKHQNAEFLAQPRWWVNAEEITDEHLGPALLTFKNVTSPTNTRTMIAAFIPPVAVGNSAPIIRVSQNISPCRYACLLANLNGFVLDYVARRKIGNVNLNFFLIEQFPMLPPDRYDEPCPWQRGVTLEAWISERVLKLTCTAEDMLPLAEACDFTGGSFGEYGGRLNKWKPQERAQLMAELDAAYFILYGIDRDDAAYILSTFAGTDTPSPALPGNRSTAEHILDTFDYLNACR